MGRFRPQGAVFALPLLLAACASDPISAPVPANPCQLLCVLERVLFGPPEPPPVVPMPPTRHAHLPVKTSTRVADHPRATAPPKPSVAAAPLKQPVVAAQPKQPAAAPPKQQTAGPQTSPALAKAAPLPPVKPTRDISVVTRSVPVRPKPHVASVAPPSLPPALMTPRPPLPHGSTNPLSRSIPGSASIVPPSWQP